MYSERAKNLGDINPLQHEAILPAGGKMKVFAVFKAPTYLSVTLEEVPQ